MLSMHIPIKKVFSLEMEVILPLSIRNFRTINYSHIPEMCLACVTLQQSSQMERTTHQPSHYTNMVAPNN